MLDMKPAANELPAPLWFKHSRSEWTQDECAPDAETGHAAWLRMFGEKPDTADAIDVHDAGDWIGWLMPNGFVYGYSCCGDFIDRAVVWAVLT